MELKLTDILDNTEEALVTKWYVSLGEEIRMGQELVELVTDKATFDVEAPCDGTLINICKKTGERVLPDEVILEIA